MTKARGSRRQRGSTMVVVMVLLVALSLAGATAIYLQVADTRAAGYVLRSREALFCAEAGLAHARPIVGSNFSDWPLTLDADDTNDPGWYPITGDLDDPPDGEVDYVVTIRDNDDELPPAINDTTRDNDLKVFIVSRCTRFPDTPREVIELIMYEGAGYNYLQQGNQGGGGTGNANTN